MFKNQMKILVVLFVLSNFYAYGFCLTPPSASDFLQTIPLKDRVSFQSDEVVIVNLYFHIIRRADGTGGQTLAEVEKAFNLLQDDFRPHGICFNLLGIGEILDDDYYVENFFYIYCNLFEKNYYFCDADLGNLFY